MDDSPDTTPAPEPASTPLAATVYVSELSGLTAEERLAIEREKTKRAEMRSSRGRAGKVKPDPKAIAAERGLVVQDDEAVEILSEIARGGFDARAADMNASIKLLLTPTARMQERLLEEFTAILAEAASAVAISRGDAGLASEILKAFRVAMEAAQAAKAGTDQR